MIVRLVVFILDWFATKRLLEVIRWKIDNPCDVCGMPCKRITSLLVDETSRDDRWEHCAPIGVMRRECRAHATKHWIYRPYEVPSDAPYWKVRDWDKLQKVIEL